jgi:hypothetical protein
MKFFAPTQRQIKISLHQLINDLFAVLQPLALNRNNILHNGVPVGLCFIAEEHDLAQTLWQLISNVVLAKKNESIQVQTLVDDHHTLICINHATNNNIVVRLSNRLMAL